MKLTFDTACYSAKSHGSLSVWIFYPGHRHTGDMRKYMDHDEKLAIVKMSVGGTGVIIYSLTLNEWVAVATLTYLFLQIGLLLPKYYQMVKEWLGK